MLIKPNLNTLDRIVRTLVGLVCIYIGFIDQHFMTNSILAWLLGIFGIINLVAAALSHCPVYRIAGYSSYKTDKHDH